MMRVSRTVNASLPGTAAYSGASARASAGANSQPATTHINVTTSSALITRLPSRHALSRDAERELSREGGHERRAHRAFGEEIPQQVGDSERHVEGVHLIARAEERSQDDPARDTQHPARQGGRADETGGPCETCAHAGAERTTRSFRVRTQPAFENGQREH